MFCKQFDLPPIPTHSALNLLSQAGYIDFTEEISTRSRVMILASKEELYSLNLDDNTDKVFQLILRTYTGLFADYVQINETLLASRLNISEQTIYESLLTLSRMHIIHYVPRKTTPYILYTTSRELPKHIDMPRAVYEDQRQRLTRRIEAMKAFAFSSNECRVNIMLQYFGEKPTTNCGKCDVCRSRKQIKTLDNKKQQLRDSIFYLASQPGGHTIKYIANETSASEDTIIDIVRELMDERLVLINNGNVTKI